MTNEEAIKCLKSLVEVRRKYGDMQTMKDEIECLNMAIKALSAKTTINPEETKLKLISADGDLISRTDLLNAIWQKEYGKDYDGVNLLNIKHIDIIEQMPSADVKPIVYGEWEIDGHHIRCNKCNIYMCNTDREGDSIPQNFCPNCGRRMKGENNGKTENQSGK